MSSINHADQAQSRIYNEYADKPKAVEWIRINGELGNEIEQAYCDVAESYDIDSATTYELDVLGRIVVISREFESQIDITAFQFDGNSTQFGGPFQFSAATEENVEAINNEVYRLLIRAKIANNNSDATLDSIILALNEIVKSGSARIIDNEDMSFIVSFSGPLTAQERFVLQTYDITPRPQGVKLLGFIDETSVPSFGGGYQFGGSQFVYTFGV